MRYAKDHKAQTRRRVIEAAGLALKRDGIDGTGVAALMAEAGLTKGGFYGHFASKDALVAEAITLTADATTRSLKAAIEQAAEPDRLTVLVERYLRPEHVAARDLGCTIGSLLSDLTRGSDPIRAAAAVGADDLVALIESCLIGMAEAERRSRAQAILGLFSGCLQLARLQPDAAARDSVLAAGRQGALLLGTTA